MDVVIAGASEKHESCMKGMTETCDASLVSVWFQHRWTGFMLVLQSHPVGSLQVNMLKGCTSYFWDRSPVPPM